MIKKSKRNIKKEFEDKMVNFFLNQVKKNFDNNKEWDSGVFYLPIYNAIRQVDYKGQNNYVLYNELLYEFNVEQELNYDKDKKLDLRVLTYLQASKLGYSCKPRKGHQILFYNQYDTKYKLLVDDTYVDKLHKLGLNDSQIKEHLKQNYIVPLVRWFHVFNVNNIYKEENGKEITYSKVNPPKTLKDDVENETKKQQRNLNFLKNLIKAFEKTGLKVNYGQVRTPYYSLNTDTITIPDLDYVKDLGVYIKIILHELAHATTAKNRLNLNVDFDFKENAKEEMIAELTTLFISNYYQIDNKKNKLEGELNTKSYLNGWLKVFFYETKEDEKEKLKEELKKLLNQAFKREKYITRLYEKEKKENNVK